jgi:hypothetical protein
MSIETHTFVDWAQTPKGYKFTDSANEYVYCFEASAASAVIAAMQTPVQVDVDRKPNAQGKVFPKIKSFHGVADSSSPAAAAAAPPSSTRPSTAGGGGSGAFKKDPVGIVLGSRQTALNAAVTYHAKDAAPRELVVATAQAFNEFLLQGLEVDLPASAVTPWSQPAVVVVPEDDIPY